MSHMTRTLLGLCLPLALLLAPGCRPDLGTPDYPIHDPDAPPPDFLLGEDPYVAGEDRLAFDLFYEGGSSERIAVDDETIFYYIYADEFSGLVTYQQFPSEDHVEGLSGDVLVHSGNAWWGGGIHLEGERDLSGWSTVSISLKSEATDFETLDLTITGGSEVRVRATDWGFVADGAWHKLVIPLSAWTEQGLDLTRVANPLQLLGGRGTAGDELLIDDFYWE